MSDQQVPQSADDGLLKVVDHGRGAQWQICSQGTCLVDCCGARLMARYEALLISQGLRVPPG